MNALKKYIADNGINEDAAMNALQKNGIVSDEAITAADVWEGDCAKAIEFFEGVAAQRELLESAVSNHAAKLAEERADR